MIRSILLSLALLFGAACTQLTGRGDGKEPAPSANQPAGAAVATPSGLSRDAVLAAFTSQEIPGFLPFRTPGAYLEWLTSRPGTASFVLDAQPLPTGAWTVSVVLTGTNGEQMQADCPFDPTMGASAAPFWQTCPQFGTLWTAFAPATFASLDEARPFLPPIGLALPEPPPGSFRVAQVLLPPAPATDLFVVRIVYVDDGGTEIVLAQQLPGTWTALFADWQRCERGQWPAPGRCRFFLSKLSAVVLSSETAAPTVLDEFARALNARQP